MSQLRFPFQRLPDDVYSEVVKTMEHHEIIAYSFTSKRALSMIQSLGLPLEDVHMKMEKLSAVYLHIGCYTVEFNMRMGEHGREITSLDDIPVCVDKSTEKLYWGLNRETMKWRMISESRVSTWSNQRMTLGEWIQHLCSIFRCEYYKSEFKIREITFDIQSLRNIFPKLRKVYINGSLEDEPNDQDIQSAQVILRAFLPYVEDVRLNAALLQENFSLQHIGTANLQELELYSLRNLKLDDLLSLNLERCSIGKKQYSLLESESFLQIMEEGI